MDARVERLKDLLGGDFNLLEQTKEEWIAYGRGGEVVAFGNTALEAMQKLYEKLRPSDTP